MGLTTNSKFRNKLNIGDTIIAVDGNILSQLKL